MDVSDNETDKPFESSESDEEVPSKFQGKSKGSLVIWLDPSVGKDSELFGVDLKNVNNLERGLAPEKLG